jgi:hypothetical protein
MLLSLGMNLILLMNKFLKSCKCRANDFNKKGRGLIVEKI